MNTVAIVAVGGAVPWGITTWLLGRTIWRVAYEQGAKDQARNDAENGQNQYGEWVELEEIEVDDAHNRAIVEQLTADVRAHEAETRRKREVN